MREIGKKFDEKTAIRNRIGKDEQISKQTDENDKSKYLIAEMLYKISMKNVSEELIPISNEVIRGQISLIEKEIHELYVEAEIK